MSFCYQCNKPFESAQLITQFVFDTGTAVKSWDEAALSCGCVALDYTFGDGLLYGSMGDKSDQPLATWEWGSGDD